MYRAENGHVHSSYIIGMNYALHTVECKERKNINRTTIRFTKIELHWGTLLTSPSEQAHVTDRSYFRLGNHIGFSVGFTIRDKPT